ncbi:MAG: metal-dependent transcriptional regulator [Gemmatimonadota bacterium]|uniref:metal-dependent transcriptional regulator n=1 Tax=Candidatus Palauibacter scopulicola TaxID=3056741 RepID=UPI00238F6167|nr:metal-dependent transcriptional regulator [Candidatus Palauibacter scopulicola]MDE2663542.1 metal-dependent transcriptional regulator [Candidatus Palauibacter scopulicola]
MKSGPADPSRAVEDYLKAVYRLQQADEPVSTTALAEELDRSAASVTNMVKSLAAQGLLRHTPYRGVLLTAAGKAAALRIIRRHRVIELYLIERLGFSWEDVHAEAERLEHAASEALIDRMAQALGEPSIDPHGSPIPTRDGELARTEWIPLAELKGGRGVVREVSDRSPRTLRELAALGLFPGTRIRYLGERAGGAARLEVDDRSFDVEPVLARAVFVERES